MIDLLLGDCLEKMHELPDNSIDSVVTDPPYGIRFMGKAWDGADIVARTAARKSLESHCPGSGPNGGHKSQAAEAGKYDLSNEGMLAFQEFSFEWAKEAYRVLKPGGHLLSFASCRTYHRMAVGIEMAGFEIRDQIQWLFGSGFPKSHNLKGEWQGWGTALKPANEPIVVARKPLEKGLTVSQNVLKWGTGALNIDESRISVDENDPNHRKATGENGNSDSMFGVGNSKRPATLTQGRWPANVILDEEAAKALDEQTQHLHGAGKAREKGDYSKSGLFNSAQTGSGHRIGDSGGASRFFYVAKASKSERNAGLEGMPLVESGIKNDSGRGFSESDPHKKILNQNFHPTVKPIKLMSYLINLVTPPNGTVLDCFLGSGTTGVAAKLLGFGFIGIEREPQYFEIAKKRIESAGKETEKQDLQMEFPA